MNTVAPNRTMSSVALGVTAVILVVMAVWGFNAATAPISDDTTNAGATPVEACAPGEVETFVDFLYRDEVTVSVYNAGKRTGRAVATMNMLEREKFRPGEEANAPAGTMVEFVEIHARASDTIPARLVALVFGKQARIVIDDGADLGPGVNVYIGDKFKKLKVAPGRYKYPEPKRVCE